MLAICTLVSACSSGSAEPTGLFDATEDRLPTADAAAITALFAEMFPPGEGGRFFDPDCGPLDPIVEVTDLNEDGSAEAFVQWGNACTSGMTGTSLSLFLKGPSGRYRHELGFPAAGYRPLARGVDGYPDLELGGPGFCFPVWSWTGAAYEYACDLPQAGGMCESGRKLCADP